MGRPRWPRAESPRLIAALAILPLTPFVASLVYRLPFGTALPSSSGIGAYLNWHTAQWTVLLVSFAVALFPAGLILMRRPNATAAWTLGVMTIALGLIGVSYVVTQVLVFLPDISPRRLRMVVALSLVPAAAGILLLRSRSISGVQALGILAIALGIVGAVRYVPEIPFVLSLDAPLWDLATWLALAIFLSIAPPIVGVSLIRNKEVSAVRSLGIVVIMLGVIGALYRANIALAHVMNRDQWYASIFIELSMVVAAVVGPTIAGTLMILKKELSVVSAVGLTTIALGVIGATYSISALISILLLLPGQLRVDHIVLTILLFAPLIVALGVVPSSAGGVLLRRAHASGAWALGLLAIVIAVVGTTFSAAQITASVTPGLFNLFIGIHLMNTAWL